MERRKPNTKKTTRKSSYKQRDSRWKQSSNRGSSRPSRGRGRGRSGGGGGRRGYTFKSIDIVSFIDKVKKESQTHKVFDIVNAFSDFAFDGRMKNNLKRLGFVTPTPIQDAAMVHIMEGEDVIGLANTGTGKTGAFLLPLISKVLQDQTQRVLIIAPTRELVIQIDDEFKQFAKGTKLHSATIIGGVGSQKQIHNLKRRPHFIIGTPGRLKDLFDRKALKLRFINNIVLDEVDRMLDMGFLPIVKGLINETRDNRQSLFFSATMPSDIKKLAGEFLKNPIVVDRQAGRTAKNVTQEVITVDDATAKFHVLKKILNDAEKTLIFSETKRSVDKLTKQLMNMGVKADCIHGNKSQNRRQKSLTNFKQNKIEVLVATDVAARGLDIKGVDTVVNYTVPQSYDDYVHRIGRTGRANAKGRAITLVTK
ncbi:MAG: DEAD/DEAH box helicase [Candidatus Magasanikbacteria bacterium]|nr:DEAD/DEAH box helicase [Candidatus Magasanikbacteria bacterium]